MLTMHRCTRMHSAIIQPAGARRCMPFVSAKRGSQRARAAPGGQPSPEEMEKMMSDPRVREQMKQYEEAMKNPEIQQQAAQMAQVMQSQEMMQKMAQLREDPELKPIFEEIQKGGMAAMMKAMNDTAFLAKIGQKLGDVPQLDAAAAAASPPAAPQAPPEITNLIEAARYGDLEAVEDFIAVGKDANQADEEKRTPLHYAVAYRHKAVFHELLANGADLAAEDSQGNSPLHYAAGYGRTEFVKDLVEKGAQTGSKNSAGHTPLDLVKLEPRNPLNGDKETLKLLGA